MVGKLSEYQSKRLAPPQDTGAFDRVSMEQRSQEAISRGIGQIGEASVNFFLQRQRIKQRNYILNQTTRMKRHFDEFETQQRKAYGGTANPERILESLEKERQRFIRDSLKEAPDDRARERWQNWSNNIYSGIEARNRDWAVQEDINYTKDTTIDAANEVAMDVYRNPNPEYLNKVAFKALDEISANFEGTVEPWQKERFEREFRQGATSSMFDSLLDKQQVKEADRLLKSKRFDDDLGADKVSYYRKKINAYKKAGAKKQKDYTMLKMLDPWKYLEKTGRMPKRPLNFADLGNDQQYLDRFVFKQELREKEGVDVPFFSPLDVAVIDRYMRSSPVSAQTEVLEHWASLPDNVYGSIGQSISPEYRVPLGLLRDGDPASREAARETLEGIRLTRVRPGEKKPDISMPKMDEFRATVSKALEGVITNPDNLTSITEAAMRASIARRLKEGEDPNSISSKDVVKVVNSYVGEPFTYNDSKLLPIKGEDGWLSDSEMSSMFDALTNKVLKETHDAVPYVKYYNSEGKPSVKPIKVEEILSDLNFRQISQTTVQMIYSDGDRQITLYRDKEGKKPFILDMRRLMPYYTEDKTFWESTVETMSGAKKAIVETLEDLTE